MSSSETAKLTSKPPDTSHLSLRSKLKQSSSIPPAGASRKRYDSHDFAGYGTYDIHHRPHHSDMGRINEQLLHAANQHKSLGELEATAISGNDILSSTFYVSGLVTLVAGTMAPVCLILVGGLLYLFRGIYHETVMALPCNGGTYNILLNSTTKQFASIAAVFAIIAYITTGVVSALEAVAYLNTVVEPYDYQIDEQWATIALLFFFCVLTNIGLSESASLAKVIFVIHVGTLSFLSILGTLHIFFNPGQLMMNYSPDTLSYPPVNMAGRVVEGTVWTALFYGVSSAMLGCSGFETSSQFVEEQAPGVFPKTLRNMWLGIMVFNPLLSLISFSALPLEEITGHSATVLSRSAGVVGTWVQEVLLGIPVQENSVTCGRILSALVSIDAFIVLAAALLTGYVGINGLIRRMAMDRCMPQFLLIANPWTGTDSIILGGFFFLCVSQVIVLDCNVEALGGVYCYSFLMVMVIFALGNILLKIKRPSLPREYSTGWIQSIVGLLGALMALLGNILGKPELLTYFFVYFIVVGLLVLTMFQRVAIMRALYKCLKPKAAKLEFREEDEDEIEFLSKMPEASITLSKRELETIFKTTRRSDKPSSSATRKSCLKAISNAVRDVQSVPFIFFCKHDDLHMLNKAMLYIQKNEQTNTVFVVHCTGTADDDEEDGEGTFQITDRKLLAEHVKLVDLLYPKVKISLLIISADFTPTTVEWLSETIGVPVNAMFISCPDENFTMKVSQLRGMRIIVSYD